MQTENEKAVRTPFFDAFEKWTEKRGVWPRLTHDEIFAAGWQAALQSQVSNTDGWVMVPVEPTSDQVNDGADAMRQAMAMFNRGRSVQTAARRVYEAMLSAAQKAKP